MSRAWWRTGRLLVGAAIVAFLLWWVGIGPFLDGIRRVDPASLAAATGFAAVTTVCCAWRWRLVARGLGVGMSLPAAVAAYYRSQFLNTTLPGGVLGDVHRAVRHGRDVGDVSRGVRAVAWERSVGQVVQLVLTVGVLLLLPSPVRSAMPAVAVTLVAAVLGGVLLIRTLPRGGPLVWRRAVRTVTADLRDGVLAPRVWPGLVLTSTVAVAGYAATFLVAARTAGATASPLRMLPLALLALVAMSVPTNIAGWGPREGASAWAFAAAGLGAAQGVTTAVVYGVLVLVATLPGAVVLAVTWRRPGTPTPVTPEVAHG